MYFQIFEKEVGEDLMDKAWVEHYPLRYEPTSNTKTQTSIRATHFLQETPNHL